MTSAPAPACVALIAHDARKQQIVAFVRRHAAFLATQRLIATRTTGTLIQTQTGLAVEAMLSGPMGGDLQIGAKVATGEVRAVVFLRDPLTAHPHEPDIAALLKVCDVYNVPLATNEATGDILVRHLAAASH
jgi:methylglyoxal synthase